MTAVLMVHFFAYLRDTFDSFGLKVDYQENTFDGDRHNRACLKNKGATDHCEAVPARIRRLRFGAGLIPSRTPELSPPQSCFAAKRLCFPQNLFVFRKNKRGIRTL